VVGTVWRGETPSSSDFLSIGAQGSRESRLTENANCTATRGPAKIPVETPLCRRLAKPSRMKLVDESRDPIRNPRSVRPRFVSDTHRRRCDEGGADAGGGENQSRAAFNFCGHVGSAKTQDLEGYLTAQIRQIEQARGRSAVRLAGWRGRLFDMPGAAAARRSEAG